MSRHNSTVGKAWFVCRQFHDKPQRFVDEAAARIYAEQLARSSCGEWAVEIFTCTNNLRADVPVVEA